AEAAKRAGEERVILIGLSGHGHFDMSAYDAFHAGELEDLEFSEADMDAALGRLPEAPGPAQRPALPLHPRRDRSNSEGDRAQVPRGRPLDTGQRDLLSRRPRADPA